MANAVKRIGMARSKPFQDRNEYYIRMQAENIFDGLVSYTSADLSLAKAVYARTINREDIAMVAVQNFEIGAAIDADLAVPEASIEWVWIGAESTAFHDLAVSLVAAGVIS